MDRGRNAMQMIHFDGYNHLLKDVQRFLNDKATMAVNGSYQFDEEEFIKIVGEKETATAVKGALKAHLSSSTKNAKKYELLKKVKSDEKIEVQSKKAKRRRIIEDSSTESETERDITIIKMNYKENKQIFELGQRIFDARIIAFKNIVVEEAKTSVYTTLRSKGYQELTLNHKRYELLWIPPIRILTKPKATISRSCDATVHTFRSPSLNHFVISSASASFWLMTFKMLPLSNNVVTLHEDSLDLFPKIRSTFPQCNFSA